MRQLLLALCLLSACARSTDPRLYTLVADKSSTTYPISTTVEVRRPSIAGYLDRREIVLAVREERLALAGDSNWAEPLDAMIGRVLAADLALRLPASRVISDASSLGVVPEARVDIEVQRFEQGASGLVLHALIAVRRGAATMPVGLERVELEQRRASDDTEGAVAAMNVLLGKLADHIARTLASAPPAAQR